jgi:uncharacterized protein YwgA
MIDKNKDLILYILYKLQETEINTTKIVKLLYFFDLIYFKNKSSLISSYDYIRYHYWPYSPKIKSDIHELFRDDYIDIDFITSPWWQDIQYFFASEKLISEFDKNILSEFIPDEIDIMNKVLEDLWGLTASQLGTLSYQTAPMKKIWAVQWEKQAWEEKLDLSIS